MSIIVIIVFIFVLLLLSICFYCQFFKRFWDIVLSGLAIIVLSPLLLVLTILGRIKMKGSPFFVQARPGKKGKDGKEKIFNLIKFRSMTEEKDKEGNYLPDDIRLTRYGKILRSTSLDELPELFNIFKGDMSIVGPRPLLVKYIPWYSEEQRKRHDVRPGFTGLAQVHGRNAINWDEKLSWDIKYVDNISFFGDIKIILKTISVVLKHEGISSATSATMESFIDYCESKGRMPRG